MNKIASKALSAALSLAMVTSIAAGPVLASGRHWISASVDGGEVYRESYPDLASVGVVDLVNDLGVGVDVKVTVNDKAFTTVRPVYMTGTLDNGTVYRLTENEDRSLSLTTTNNQLNDDINVSVERTAKEYTVTSNSGPAGFKDDLGSDSNPTCTVSSGVTTVAGNSFWQGTFTPKDGQVIKSLNIRTSAPGRNIISIDAGTVKVGDTELTITRNNGAITVRTEHTANDLFITALTADLATQYELSVVTVGDVSSSVVSALLDAGTTKEVVLTPGDAGIVDAIEINDGGKTGTLTTGKTSITVNGHAYKASWAMDGKATVTVPSISANVVLTASATSNRVGLSISVPSDVTCSLPEQSYPEKGSFVEIRLTPDRDFRITSIQIQSSTDSFTLSGNENRFALDGRSYRVENHSDGSQTIYFDDFPGNIQISVASKEIRHTVTLEAGSGCEYDGGSGRLTVDDGRSRTISFSALGSEDIQRLVFTVNGSEYTVSRGDSYIRINGTRCPITWEDGHVSVTLYDVVSSMTVKAYTTAYNEDYVIRVDHDNGVTTFSSRVYANYGSSKTITFTERSGYTVERIDVVLNGKTYSAYRGDSYITIDGRRCSLSWTTTKTSITIGSVRSDMDIYCATDYGRGTASDIEYLITVDHDGGVSTADSCVYVDSGKSKTITFTEQNGYEIKRIDVVVDGKTYSAYRGDSYITVNGRRCSLSWTTTKASITLNSVRSDMNVFCDTNYNGTNTLSDGDYVISVSCDSGASTASDRVYVSRDGSRTITFTGKNGHTIERVDVTVNGKIYSAYRGSSYIIVEGKNCKLNWASATVSITFSSVQTNMDVFCITDYSEPALPPSNADGSAATDSTGGTVHQGSVYHCAYISGMGNGQFAPDRAITRAEALTILLRAYQNADKVPLTGAIATPFMDVSPSDWYYGYVSYAYNQGLLAGLHNVSIAAFRPNDAITRAEYVEMAARIMGIGNAHIPTVTQFTDVMAGHWASGMISYAATRGWISGYPDGSFKPEGSLTRAEMVSITNRVLGRTADRSGLDAAAGRLTAFTDVGPSHWAYYDILEAANAHYCDVTGGVERWA